MVTKIITVNWYRIFIALMMAFQPLAGMSQEFRVQGIYISGRIINFDSARSQQTVSFLKRSLTGPPEKLVATIRPDGGFEFKTSIAIPQDITLNYQGFAQLFLCPGDSLQVLINADKKPGQTVSDFITIESGRHSQENLAIIRFLQEKEKAYANEEEQRAIKEKTPVAFQQYIFQAMRAEEKFLKDFKLKWPTTRLFNKWAEDYLKYEGWNKLLRYGWENPMLNGLERSQLNLGPDYLEFMSEYNMNDHQIISAPHIDFLYELYRIYLKKLNAAQKDSLAQMTKRKDVSGMIRLYVHSLSSQTKGFTRDVFLARMFIDAISGYQLKEFESAWAPGSVSSAYFRSMILRESRKVKAFLQNQDVKKESLLVTLDQRIIQPLIDTIIAKYAGKVIYIDFWAPWCVPCMQAMPASEEIQSRYRGKEIIFLFLASRCSDESWKATIANKLLKGVHINLTDDQFNILSAKFNITGIPHYVIIDKQGKIIDPNAPGPERKTELIDQLDRLTR
jgi:thiol-disulfide isomerase/thioredoxin